MKRRPNVLITLTQFGLEAIFSPNSPENHILETSIGHKNSEKGPTFSPKIPERVDVETIRWHTPMRKYYDSPRAEMTLEKKSRVLKNTLLSALAFGNYSLSSYGASFEKFLNVIMICLISSLIACECWEFLNVLKRLIAFHSIELVVRQTKANVLLQVE